MYGGITPTPIRKENDLGSSENLFFILTDNKPESKKEDKRISIIQRPFNKNGFSMGGNILLEFAYNKEGKIRTITSHYSRFEILSILENSHVSAHLIADLRHALLATDLQLPQSNTKAHTKYEKEIKDANINEYNIKKMKLYRHAKKEYVNELIIMNYKV